jgi:mRNA-degrading endonuclease RelE of RelBE toxin-antitoxin system
MLDKQQLCKLIDKILQDPIQLQKLSDKVYELMKEDLQIQRERSGNYRR